MTTLRKYKQYWTESKRVVYVAQDQPQVKVVACCCAAPAARRRECADAAGIKTPFRCFCHSNVIDPVLRRKKP